ncbi:hypothetical protein ACFV0O_34350 [Kitasatospora sp. NPDC059577]|uniref:hypothetical protein n=1 Tax=unclassified Kitasatospora TaxID=2633591 RepID=UPI0036776452
MLEVGHEVGDVCVVGVVAVAGELVEVADRGVERAVVVQDGVVEAVGEGGAGGPPAGGADFGVEDARAV